MNPAQEEFGTERLAAFLRQNATLPPAELVRELRTWLRDFTNGQPLADDTTVVICKVA
jgi:serine phosphatase RsbU (regulator of sigma subunit)